MFALLQGLSDHLARLMVLLAVLGVGGYLAFEWLTGPPDAATELRRANPGWAIESSRHAGLRVSGGGVDAYINGDDAGPVRLQPLDCSQVLPSLPTWLSLPSGRNAGCLQLGDTAPFTRVLNHRMGMPITELWSQRLQPQLDELKLPYWGGSSGRGVDGPAGTTPGRGYRSMSYGIDPAPGSTDPQVNLMAFYLGDDTVLVVTLRPTGAR